MIGGKLDHSKAIDFILAGNSHTTFLNTESKNRFTFQVRKHKKDDIFFVSVLTGPDSYTFIGSIKQNKYKHSPKSTISAAAKSVKTFEYVFNKLVINTLSEIVEIWHEGSCGKCGKRLTDPKSIKSGFGTFCLKNKNK